MIDNSELPQHIAIVMDGNGRWATKRGLPRLMGHRAGVQAAKQIIKFAAQKGIKAISLFAFGQDNWQRPQSEISHLFKLLSSSLRKESQQLIKNNIKINFVGDLSALPEKLQTKIQMVYEQSKLNTGMILNILINYSGKWDITNAVNLLIKDIIAGKQTLDDINELAISKQLVCQDLPDPDLFIRTSGEQRISNCFLWQLAYTEFYFTEVLWPDFSQQDFELALESFMQRERRFGKITEQLA